MDYAGDVRRCSEEEQRLHTLFDQQEIEIPQQRDLINSRPANHPQDGVDVEDLQLQTLLAQIQRTTNRHTTATVQVRLEEARRLYNENIEAPRPAPTRGNLGIVRENVPDLHGNVVYRQNIDLTTNDDEVDRLDLLLEQQGTEATRRQVVLELQRLAVRQQK
jgi:hypothetical protein